MKQLEDLLEFLRTEKEAAKQIKLNAERAPARIYADGKETAYCIVIGEIQAILAKNLPQAAVSGSLPHDIAKEAAFLLQIDGVTHCPKWVEGVGDCRMLDCLFCRKQRCVEALEEPRRQ